MQSDYVPCRLGFNTNKTVRRNVYLKDSRFETKNGIYINNELRSGRITGQAYAEIMSQVEDLNRTLGQEELELEQFESRKKERRRKLVTDSSFELPTKKSIEDIRSENPNL